MHIVKRVHWQLPPTTVPGIPWDPWDITGLASEVLCSFRNSVFIEDDITCAEDAYITSSNISKQGLIIPIALRVLPANQWDTQCDLV